MKLEELKKLEREATIRKTFYRAVRFDASRSQLFLSNTWHATREKAEWFGRNLGEIVRIEERTEDVSEDYYYRPTR